DESVIEGNFSGVYSYIYPDGTKMSKSAPLIEVYQNEQDLKNVKIIKNLENEIAMLKQAQSANDSTYINSDSLYNGIFQNLGKIIQASNSGKTIDILETKTNITLLLNKKQAFTLKTLDFSDRINSLTNQVNSLKKSISSNPQIITAAKSGYYSRASDGLEGVLNSSVLNKLTIAQYTDYINNRANINTQGLGKIVENHNWYFAAAITKDNAEKLKSVPNISINFPQYHLNNIPVKSVEYLFDDNSENGIAILKLDYISSDLISMRNSNIEINLKSYSGLKVRKSAVRFINEKPGVYVVSGYNIVFKEIDIVYDNSGFILSRPDNTKENRLEMFDEIIVEGTELYDGKPVK
ncbi:MAG TPA: hypothetical protein DCP97_04775, partial [Ruminococcaceae bacterium]|nr:hypothetical protein [Oscillospiraceae bacterium]